jgi:hypothetical protein
MAHTNDIGLLIADAFDLTDTIHLVDWDKEELTRFSPIRTLDILEVDASHGFSELFVTTSDGKFRVSITRIG